MLQGSTRNNPFCTTAQGHPLTEASTRFFGGSIAIITIAEDGTVMPLLDNTGPFAGFDDLDLSDHSSLAFDGHQWSGLGGVWCMDTNGSSTSITKITKANATGSTDFTAVSINDSGPIGDCQPVNRDSSSPVQRVDILQ